DGGGGWKAVNTGLANLNVFCLMIDPQTPTTLYVGVELAGVFKSTNGGGSWSPVNTGLPDYPSVPALVIDPQTPTTLYAAASGFVAGIGVFKGIDGGGNWIAVNNGLGSPPYVFAL